MAERGGLSSLVLLERKKVIMMKDQITGVEEPVGRVMSCFEITLSCFVQKPAFEQSTTNEVEGNIVEMCPK